MRIIAVILCVVCLAGCGKRKPTGPAPQSAVATFQTKSIPVPDATPTALNIQGAKTDVEIAQENVQTVLKVAQSTPAAQAAVAPLTSADVHLTTALQKLAEATSTINKLTDEIKSADKAHTEQFALLQKAASSDAIAQAKYAKELEAENEDLRNEAMQKLQYRMYLLGALMCLGGVLGFGLSVYFGFEIGSKLAAPLGVLGILIIGLAKALPRIALYAEWGIVAGAIVLAGYIAWHLFHHEPSKAKTVRMKK